MDQDRPPPYSSIQGQPPHGGPSQPPYNSIHGGPSEPPYPTGPYVPPPQPGIKPDFYPPPQPAPETVTTHVLITSAQHRVLGPSPQTMTCPSCHAQITTSVTTEPSTKTHLFALLLCLFQCYLCCCIPYCVDSCQSQQHHCPNCGAFLGSYDN